MGAETDVREIQRFAKTSNQSDTCCCTHTHTYLRKTTVQIKAEKNSAETNENSDEIGCKLHLQLDVASCQTDRN